jgi:hypothetical protein
LPDRELAKTASIAYIPKSAMYTPPARHLPRDELAPNFGAARLFPT